MTALYVFLTTIPLWQWLVTVGCIALFTLMGAIIEIVRSRHHFSKSRSRASMTVSVTVPPKQ